MAEPLKDLLNAALVDELCAALSQRYPAFDSGAFRTRVLDEDWSGRELKARMRHIAASLYRFLPARFEQAAEILTDACGEFAGFQYMFFPEYIELYGQAHFTASMQALQQMTPYASAEFAIRPFIKTEQAKTMAVMQRWSDDPNEHVRRLASEGCRPRLPWAMALPAFKRNPAPILPIIEQLKQDQSEYVRRSVGNNLNDISKDNPQLVIDFARQWLGQDRHIDWVIRHGCRSLLKQGRADALSLFGYQPPDDLHLIEFKSPGRVRMGEDLEFDFLLESSQALGLCRIEYCLDMPRANNRRGRKVFMISDGRYPDNTREFSARHKFRTITTRRYYPGLHGLEILVNGVTLFRHEFNLVMR